MGGNNSPFGVVGRLRRKCSNESHGSDEKEAGRRFRGPNRTEFANSKRFPAHDLGLTSDRYNCPSTIARLEKKTRVPLANLPGIGGVGQIGR